MQAQLRGHRAIVSGQTPDEILERLRQSTPFPEESFDRWIAEYARRYELWHGRPIDTSSTDAFWTALKKSGEIRIWP